MIVSDHSIRVRAATPADRPRILEISSQIWDGDDYVPELLDRWFADTEGELVVATTRGKVIAFAHRTWTLPGIAWLEGIRTDPACQGRGAGKAITEYLIRSSEEAGAKQIHLSTYIDNESSIHIIESYGFRLAGTFSYLERTGVAAAPVAGRQDDRIHPLSLDETIQFVGSSEYLALAQRRFAHGWKFLPFDQSPRRAIAPLVCRLGYWQADTLEAAVCIRQPQGPGGWTTLNFLDGEKEGMRILLDHVLQLYAGRTLEMMVPVLHGKHAAALNLLQDMGFTSWSDFKTDVFVYEMVL